MGLFVPVAARMATGALLLTLFLASPSVAQTPDPGAVLGGVLAINVDCQDTFLQPPYARVDRVTCLVQDISRDSVGVPGERGFGPSPHRVTIEVVARNESSNATGWQVLVSNPLIQLYGGDIIPFDIIAQATPVITTQEYHFDVIARYTGPGGHNQTVVVPMSAEVDNYDFALLSWVTGTQVQKAGQDDIVTFSIIIENTGVYPDYYRVSATSDDDLQVIAAPTVYVPAGESRIVNVTVLTPHGKLYEQGRTASINIKVTSGTGSSSYTATGSLQIRGSYIPIYWIPLFLVGAVSAGVLVRGSRESRELRRLEKGRPRPVALTPRQEVLLAEMRKAQPEAYKEKRQSLDVVYKERLADYRAHRKERAAADREQAKLARAEFLARKKAMKAERKEQKRAKKAAKKQAKIDAKAAKKEAKILAKKEKVLQKKKAKLEKKQAKIDKKQAKIDAKAAKAQAKADKAAAREAKKAEKAAAKAAKQQK